VVPYFTVTPFELRLLTGGPLPASPGGRLALVSLAGTVLVLTISLPPRQSGNSFEALGCLYYFLNSTVQLRSYFLAPTTFRHGVLSIGP